MPTFCFNFPPSYLKKWTRKKKRRKKKRMRSVKPCHSLIRCLRSLCKNISENTIERCPHFLLAVSVSNCFTIVLFWLCSLLIPKTWLEVCNLTVQPALINVRGHRAILLPETARDVVLQGLKEFKPAFQSIRVMPGTHCAFLHSALVSQHEHWQMISWPVVLKTNSARPTLSVACK